MLADERNRNVRGPIAGGDIFNPALPDGPGFREAGKGSCIGSWGFGGEEGFGMDQQHGQVGIGLARVHWLWEHLGHQRLYCVQLLQDPTGSQGGHSQRVICSGRSPAPEALPAPAETAYFSS